MSIEEYIESGILEAYVLGHLTESEQAEVEKMAADHLEIKKALRELSDNIRVDAHFKSARPKEFVLKEVKSDITSSEKGKLLNEIGIKPKMRKILSPLQIAASVIILASIALNIILYFSWKNSNEQVTEYANIYQSLSNKYADAEAKLSSAEETIKHFHNHGLVKVAMNETTESPAVAVGTVFYNPQSNNLFIYIDNMPSPPQGHKYEIWAVKGEENVVSAGKVKASKGFHKLGSLDAEVKGFLITLEPEDNDTGVSKGGVQWQGFLN
ncbi:MAG: anti-sigma factor [Bacteroidota bacterium]